MAMLSIMVPNKVLVIRVKKSGAAEVTQVLIKWSHMSQDLATWEDKVSLMQQFPSVHAWGQAGHQNRRGVSIVTLPGRRAASTRTSKPNPKVTGLEWAGPCEDTIAGHQETDCMSVHLNRETRDKRTTLMIVTEYSELYPKTHPSFPNYFCVLLCSSFSYSNRI
jgi:hypothetical protein